MTETEKRLTENTRLAMAGEWLRNTLDDDPNKDSVSLDQLRWRSLDEQTSFWGNRHDMPNVFEDEEVPEQLLNRFRRFRHYYRYLMKRRSLLEPEFIESAPSKVPLLEESQHTEHEFTRKLICEKIDSLSDELAKKEDLLRAKEEVIENIRTEAEKTRSDLENRIIYLQKSLVRFLPYKRAARLSFYFISLFSFALLADLVLGVTIMDRFWTSIGICVSGGFSVMSYFLYLDWQKTQKEKT